MKKMLLLFFFMMICKIVYAKEYLGSFSINSYASDSINNPHSRYGSRYSNESVNNPYAINTPIIIGGAGYGW